MPKRMFKRTVWIFVLFSIYGGSLCKTRRSIHAQDRKFRRDLQMTWSKRSIALVDEDFDVPPVNNVEKEYDDLFDERLGNSLEGSGDIRQETETAISLTSSRTTQSNSKGTREQTDTSETKTFSSSTSAENKSETRGYDSDETKSPSSSPRTLSVSVSQTETLKTKTSVVPYSTKSSESTKAPRNTRGSQEISDSHLVSSGDGTSESIQKQSTTERIQVDEDENPFGYVSNVCYNTTCAESDLSIQPSEVCLIPEGTNITLTCRSNFSNDHILYWYKSNVSIHLGQTFGTNQTQLHFPDTKTYHSGMYKCVKWVDMDFCCSKDIHLTVYELPYYKYHIIVLALIAAIMLLVCIWLQVRQAKKFSVYSKEYTTKHGKAEEQLLWN